MTIRCALAAGLVATCALPSQAQVITQRDVGVRMGLAVAVGALDQCEKDGNSVSVAVVDRAGRLRVFLQSDRPIPTTSSLPAARLTRRGLSAAPAPNGRSEPPKCPSSLPSVSLPM